VDIDSVLRAKIHTGYYQVVAGDILELQMPAALRIISSDLSNWFKPVSGHDDVEPYLFRVSDAGTITLPIVGEMTVAGKKLTEIEIAVVNAYYPKYVANLPSVVCKVKEYQYRNVTVIGAVVQPGLYRLRSDEMSLVAALMKAGGIVEEGASVITIERSNHSGGQKQFGNKTNINPVPVFSPVYAKKDESSQAPQENKSSAKKKYLIVTSQNKVMYSSETDIANEKDSNAFREKCNEFIEKDQIYFFFQVDNLTDTKGDLAVSRGREVLYSAEIDIVSEKDKKAFAKDIGKKHPAIRAANVMREIEYIAENHATEQLARKIEQSSIAKFERNTRNIGPTLVSSKDDNNSGTIVLPVKGLNIPFADVALHDGDTVEVERFDPAVFTVLGPVEKPGTFDYPPDIQYNLMQALAFAGGPDLVLDPRYVTIYRQDANGEIVFATFGLDRNSLAKASKIKIKPGDVISVEMTAATRARIILKELFYIRVGYDIDELISSR